MSKTSKQITSKQITSKQLTTKLLEYSIEHKIGHIPSALSMMEYLRIVLPLVETYHISIGKAHGAQAYYVVWEEGDYSITDRNSVLSHKDKLVDFSTDVLSPALGVGAGFALDGLQTYVNIGDAAFQMGPTLEAIQFIGANQLNMLMTVDCNGMQLTENINKVINTNSRYISNILKQSGWDVLIYPTITDENREDITKSIQYRLKNQTKTKIPTALLFETIKGHNVKEMEENPFGWHYKLLGDINEITIK